MELPVRLPVLPAQCYSPSPDRGGFEVRRGVPASRQPLQESTGNIQHPHMAWYAQHLEALSSMPPLIPPVLRTQSLGPECSTGTPTYPGARQGQQQRHEHHHHHHAHGRRRSHGINPLMPLLTQAFQNYRKKQADKQDQTWPDVLEAPFLDALLLIPQIRRQKYTMKQTQYGRNMLIGEYLWIAYCQSLPPGAEPDPSMMRERKKVSSHIQVLKNFFLNHRCFHFFFGGRRPEDKEKKDSTETVSLKNNPVLIALSEGRLPDERPNYEYFVQILALNDQVQFRPKRCWIFVSHKDVVVGEDGAGYSSTTSGKLSESEYPHLGRNLERETWAKEEQQFFKGALLHEFTKEMHQVDSSTVRELNKRWEPAFPELHQRLKAITSTTTDTQCDILHLHATLELKEKRNFPAGSSLSSWVEINIEQPRLLNHRWKVETRLVRPHELSYPHEDSASRVIHEQHKEFSLKYQHRPGCDGSRNDGRGHCDCLSQRSRRDGVLVPFPVPFPADAWAQTLTNCAEYPAHPFSDKKGHDQERGVGEDEEGQRASRRRTKLPTQMDLVPKIAMMQEIFSRPPVSPHEEFDEDSPHQRWTRRAVILWTFETIHSLDDKGKLVTAQGGRTNWRFLTILDPASEYHQRNAIIIGRRSSGDDHREASPYNLAGTSRPASRGTVMSPSPTYQQHLNASMSENFAPAWDSAGGLGSLSGTAAQVAYGAHFMSQTLPSHTSTPSQTGYGLLDSFSSYSGLTTPPPSASLASSFGQAFDTASTAGSDMLPSYLATAVTTAAGLNGGAPHTLAMTDPFLAAHVGATYAESQESVHDWGSQHIVVGGTMDPAAAAASWSAGYSAAAAAAAGHPGVGGVHWAGHHQHRHQPQQQHQAPSSSGSSSTPREQHQQQHSRHPSQQQQQQPPRHDDWVVPNPTLHTGAPSSSTGSVPDLSPHDAGVIPGSLLNGLPRAAAAAAEMHSPPSSSPGRVAHGGELQMQMPVPVKREGHGAGVVAGLARGRKRGRTESFGDEEDEEEEAGWVARRVRG